VPEHTRIACSALTETSVDKAVAIADDTAVASASHGSQPPYEIWRQRIRAHFTHGIGELVLCSRVWR
jgi:enediyne biosynthesis protein E2